MTLMALSDRPFSTENGLQPYQHTTEYDSCDDNTEPAIWANSVQPDSKQSTTARSATRLQKRPSPQCVLESPRVPLHARISKDSFHTPEDVKDAFLDGPYDHAQSLPLAAEVSSDEHINVIGIHLQKEGQLFDQASTTTKTGQAPPGDFRNSILGRSSQDTELQGSSSDTHNMGSSIEGNSTMYGTGGVGTSFEPIAVRTPSMAIAADTWAEKKRLLREKLANKSPSHSNENLRGAGDRSQQTSAYKPVQGFVVPGTSDRFMPQDPLSDIQEGTERPLSRPEHGGHTSKGALPSGGGVSMFGHSISETSLPRFDSSNDEQLDAISNSLTGSHSERTASRSTLADDAISSEKELSLCMTPEVDDCRHPPLALVQQFELDKALPPVLQIEEQPPQSDAYAAPALTKMQSHGFGQTGSGPLLSHYQGETLPVRDVADGTRIPDQIAATFDPVLSKSHGPVSLQNTHTMPQNQGDKQAPATCPSAVIKDRDLQNVNDRLADELLEELGRPSIAVDLPEYTLLPSLSQSLYGPKASTPAPAAEPEMSETLNSCRDKSLPDEPQQNTIEFHSEDTSRVLESSQLRPRKDSISRFLEVMSPVPSIVQQEIRENTTAGQLVEPKLVDLLRIDDIANIPDHATRLAELRRRRQALIDCPHELSHYLQMARARVEARGASLIMPPAKTTMSRSQRSSDGSLLALRTSEPIVKSPRGFFSSLKKESKRLGVNSRNLFGSGQRSVSIDSASILTPRPPSTASRRGSSTNLGYSMRSSEQTGHPRRADSRRSSDTSQKPSLSTAYGMRTRSDVNLGTRYNPANNTDAAMSVDTSESLSRPNWPLTTTTTGRGGSDLPAMPEAVNPALKLSAPANTLQVERLHSLLPHITKSALSTALLAAGGDETRAIGIAVLANKA